MGGVRPQGQGEGLSSKSHLPISPSIVHKWCGFLSARLPHTNCLGAKLFDRSSSAYREVPISRQPSVTCENIFEQRTS